MWGRVDWNALKRLHREPQSRSVIKIILSGEDSLIAKLFDINFQLGWVKLNFQKRIK